MNAQIQSVVDAINAIPQDILLVGMAVTLVFVLRWCLRTIVRSLD